MAQEDVATLKADFAHATSMFELSELTGLAHTALAQRTEELQTSVDKVETAVTTGGQNAVIAIGGVKEATNDLQTSVGDVKAAVTTGSRQVQSAIHDVRDAATGLTASVGEVKTAVTNGAERSEAAIHGVRHAATELTISVGEVRTAISHGAERVASAINELTFELKNLYPDRPRDKFFRIIAPEDTDEAARMQLEQLEKAVDAAIRAEKLAAFLEYMQRWEDLGPSPNTKRPSKDRHQKMK